MSSRRGAGEDNILALLEREGARRGGGRMSTLRLAWYGAGAALCGVLVGGLAWLAYDSQQPTDSLQARADAPAAAEPARARTQSSGTLAAVIVDEQPRMRTAPPLVMLAPQDGPARPAPRPEPASAPAARPAPATPSTAPADAPRVATDKRPSKPARARTPEPKPAARRTLVAKAGAGTPVAALRLRKPSTPSSAEPQVDGDVALISAIIAQSERHRGEEAPACAGAKCVLKSARP